MTTKAELQEKLVVERTNLYGANQEIERLKRELSEAALDLERMRADRARDRGRAEAFQEAFHRLAAHHEILSGREAPRVSTTDGYKEEEALAEQLSPMRNLKHPWDKQF